MSEGSAVLGPTEDVSDPCLRAACAVATANGRALAWQLPAQRRTEDLVGAPPCFGSFFALAILESIPLTLSRALSLSLANTT